MNSFVRFVLENGGSDYDLMYPQSIFKRKYCTSNTSCVWFNNELIINTRLVEYIKLFQNDNIRVLTSENYTQTYFYTKNGFNSRNIMSKFSDGTLCDTIETIYPDSTYWDCYYRGLEDGRLVVWNDKLYIYGTRWDRVEDKGCICIYELDENMQPFNEIIVHPQGSGNCEKNWGAVEDRPFTFVYCNNPTDIVQVNERGDCWLVKSNGKNENITKAIKGSTQIVRYDDNTYISMVHTNDWHVKGEFSYSDYLTAFVFYDNDLNIIKMSDWFVFKAPMCEFTCGMAIKGDDVYITYSQLDCTSSILITNKDTINKFVDLHEDLNNTYGFIDYYQIAKFFENNNQFMSAYGLYNYALTLNDNNPIYREIEIECLIKMLCGVIKQCGDFRKKTYYNEIKERINYYISKYPEVCELYYLYSYICKVEQNLAESNMYKQMGDERKLNIHKYFFKYFNSNYL